VIGQTCRNCRGDAQGRVKLAKIVVHEMNRQRFTSAEAKQINLAKRQSSQSKSDFIRIRLLSQAEHVNLTP
jgi:hypothetical protein